MLETQDMIDRGNRTILERMNSLDSGLEDSLLAFYSSGFALFGVELNKVVWPNNAHTPRDWDIDWPSASLLSRDSSGFCLMYPTMTYKPSNWTIDKCRTCFELGEPEGKVVQWTFENSDWPDYVLVELLDKSPAGWIFVIGFRPKSEPIHWESD